MSATAAIGIPKLLAGPQKSALQKYHHQLANIHKADIVRNFSRNSERQEEGDCELHTGRAEVIEVLIRPYLRIERFHCGGHGEGCVLGGESEN
jgi:hypothetical protein